MELLNQIEPPVVADDPSLVGTNRWRMVTTFGLSGPGNMALDEALLESVIAGGPPALRFYTWQPATLSLGVNQPLGEVDPTECARRGFGLVRRVTGGRAVLHQHELTYSIVARENDPVVSGGVIESYRKLSLGLVEGLRLLGADVSLAPPNRSMRRSLMEARREGRPGEEAEGSHGAVCFDAASDYELTASGMKLVGSAQARRGGALLQHGSILLDIDWEAWASVFAYRSEEGRRRAALKLPTRMTSLTRELGHAVSAEEAASVIGEGFGRALGLGLELSSPSGGEIAAARRLEAERYGSRAWTEKK